MKFPKTLSIRSYAPILRVCSWSKHHAYLHWAHRDELRTKNTPIVYRTDETACFISPNALFLQVSPCKSHAESMHMCAYFVRLQVSHSCRNRKYPKTLSVRSYASILRVCSWSKKSRVSILCS